MGVIVRQKEKEKGAPYWVFISHKGRRTSKCIGSKDAAMAVAKRIELRLAVGDYEFLDQNKKKEKNFNEYAKVWIENVVPTICKPSTAEDYVQILAKHILPVFGDMGISKITRGIVKDFLLGQLQKGYATSTVIHMKNVVSGILNKAMDDEDIVVNPAQQLGRIFTSKDKSETINPLTKEELKHFLDVAREFFPENYAFLLLLARTGMRVGEALALRWDDLDFNNRFITIARNYVRGELQLPKNNKSRRVDMSQQLRDALLQHREKIRERVMIKNTAMPEFVFSNKSDYLVDVNNWRRRVYKKMLAKAGLRHIRIHDLRHTYATLRIMKGDNIADVSNQLGHHSIKFTMDIYYHWIPGGKKTEIDALDD